MQADNKVIPTCGGNAYLDAKFVLLENLSLGDTLNLRCMEPVKFIPVLALLLKHPFSPMRLHHLDMEEGSMGSWC